MYQGKIEVAPFNLFNVERNPIGGGRDGEQARKATDREVGEYLHWLALRYGPAWPDFMEVRRTDYRKGHEQRILGATFGKKLANATVAAPAQYADGSYSIPMPGANQRGTVTMETLDDSGAVIASQSLPVEPKKRGIIWDRAAVRKAAGPVAKPVKARKTVTPAVEKTETPPAVANAPAPVDFSPVQPQEPVMGPELPSQPEVAASADGAAADAQSDGDWLALVDHVSTKTAETETAPAGLSTDVVALVARLEAVEAQLAALSHYDTHPAHENEQSDAGNVLPGPWKGARALHAMRAEYEAEQRADDRARRERIVRAYLRMRRERNSLRAHLSIGQAQYDDMKAARVAADKRAESLEFDMVDLRAQLAKESARADAAEAIAAPALDKAQARITQLEERMAALPKPKVPFKLAMTMGAYKPPVAMGRAG